MFAVVRVRWIIILNDNTKAGSTDHRSTRLLLNDVFVNKSFLRLGGQCFENKICSTKVIVRRTKKISSLINWQLDGLPLVYYCHLLYIRLYFEVNVLYVNVKCIVTCVFASFSGYKLRSKLTRWFYISVIKQPAILRCLPIIVWITYIILH